MATRVSSPVLIGRQTELQALAAAWDEAAAGRPSTVLVGGEAGIGKSRLVAELVGQAQETGGAVLATAVGRGAWLRRRGPDRQPHRPSGPQWDAVPADDRPTDLDHEQCRTAGGSNEGPRAGGRVLREAAARMRSSSDAQFTAPIAAGIIELELAEGRLDDAWDTATEAIASVGETDDAGLLVLLQTEGARVAADRALASAAAHRETDRQAAIADATRLADEAAATLRDVDPTGPAANEPLGYLALARAEAARATGEGAVEAWARAADHWAGVGRPWFLAYSRYRQGEALLSVGERGAAARVLADARAIAESLGAAPLREDIDGLARRARLTLQVQIETEPVTASAPAPEQPTAADPFGLTSREREVLALVAAGQTNRQIADALFISQSTAGVHVSNILGKLGVASRTEAAAVAVRLGLAN